MSSMQRHRVPGHPGVTERKWRDRSGRVTHRYDATYRGADRKEHTKSFLRLGDADRWLRDERTRKDRGAWIDPSLGREPLEEFWGRWRSRAEELGRPSERTLLAYDELWRLYIKPMVGHSPLNAITRSDVREVVETAGRVSAYRGQDALKVLRMILNRALDEELILRSPAAGVPAPKTEQREPWVLTPEEVELVAETVPDRYRALVLVGAYASLRWSELIALRVDRLDLPRRRIRVEEKIVEHGRLIAGEPKTRQSRRAVAIPESITLELAEHLRRFPAGPDRLVFAAPEGGPIRRPHFYAKVWKPATIAAGLEGFPVKNLRHTGASLAIAVGADSMLVAARLGHTSTRMVEKHYVSLFEGLDREIGEKLGAMREGRKAESKRLQPEPSRAGAGYLRDRSRRVVPIKSRQSAESSG